MTQFIRGIVQSITASAGKLMRFSATGRPGETIEKREALQQYGFSSSPPSGSECLILKEGNHFLLIASDKREYRIALESGQVCIYAGSNSRILLKPAGQIEITCSSATINASSISLGGTGASALIDERLVAVYNAHVHPDPVSGVSGIPSVLLGDVPPAVAVTTSKTKAL